MIDKNSSPPSLPKGWVRTPVGELYDIVGGGTPSTSVAEYWNGDIRWITSADIHGVNDVRPRKSITKAGIKNSATNLVPSGSLIVVTRVGLGKIALTKVPLCFSQDSQALVGNIQLIDPEYALYYMSKAVQAFRYENRGTTIAGVTKKQLGELLFALPPLHEQHRIVAKIEELFTRLDAGVDALNKIKLQFKRYRQAVLKAAFEGKLTAEWREAHKGELEPASVLLEKVKAERAKSGKYKELPPLDTTNLPELPEGWVYLTLDYLVSNDHNSIKRGPFGSAIKKSYFVRSGYKVYEQGNVIYNDFARGDYFISEDKFNEMKGFAIRPGDILMSCSGTVGKIAIVPEGIQRGIINQALLKIGLNNSVVATPYFVYLLRSQIDEVLLKNTRGSAMVNISSVRDLRQLPLAISPLAEQQRIVGEIEHHLSVADEIEKVVEQSLTQSERLRQSTLKRAFEGKLVPQDPSDEPAEKLLERIKAEKAGQQAGDKAARGRNRRNRSRGRLV